MRAHRWLNIGMVLAAAALAACDGADPTAPQQAGPRLLGADGPVCYAAGSSTLQLLDTGLELSMVFTVDREIGPEGGSFGIGGSRLNVPAGAVGEPTLFRMQLTFGRHILVDLEATSLADGQYVSSFVVPVNVEIGYQRMQGYDPSQLVLVWLQDGTPEGARIEIPTTVDTERRRILADLDHFSIYAIAIN